MNYIIEILDNDYKIIDTKKAYTIEELKMFYIEEYKDYYYRLYKLTTINIFE